ncbi:MAG: DNA-protecting protein DprA [Muribaculum sp.]|nr:DNA-protecting protein DprA [Muribaculum sp.]
MNDNKLTIEEIQCLIWFGITPIQIRKTDLDAFDNLYNENQEQFDAWLDKAERLFDKEFEMGVKIVSIQDDNYPKQLLAIGDDAPPLIHLLGNSKLIERTDSVAIIGARAADRQGLDAAFTLGVKYASEGKVIVSGLALGCDKAAHEGCLSASGETIAIVASGLDIIHPIENKQLQSRILETGGLVLSEQHIGVQANPSRLVARNRLQAALSESVILAQCPDRSGSMHTMRFARKYHKKSYAVAYPKYTEINGGNKLLIESKQAFPLRYDN